MTYKEALESIKRNSDSTADANTAAGNTAATNAAAANTAIVPDTRYKSRQLPGTLFSVAIPSGTTVNFRDFFEVSTPGGMSINVRMPILGNLAASGLKYFTPLGMMDAFRAAGGTIEIVNN